MILRSAPQRIETAPGVLVHDVPWDIYSRLVELPGAFHLRMTYDKGELEIMPPLPEHDWWKKIFATMIEDLAYEMRIHYVAYGSTTWKREDAGQGVEADECYYVQHAREVGFKRRFDLTADPPPDLAVEIDITSRSIPRQRVYARLGVPEVWRFDGRVLEFLALGRKGSYEVRGTSLAFPFLSPADLEPFLEAAETTEPLDFRDRFREWVKSEVKPRVGQGPP